MSPLEPAVPDRDERRLALAWATGLWFAGQWGFLALNMANGGGRIPVGITWCFMALVVAGAVRFYQGARADGGGVAAVGAALAFLPLLPIFPWVAWRKRASLQPFAGYL